MFTSRALADNQDSPLYLRSMERLGQGPKTQGFEKYHIANPLITRDIPKAWMAGRVCAFMPSTMFTSLPRANDQVLLFLANFLILLDTFPNIISKFLIK